MKDVRGRIQQEGDPTRVGLLERNLPQPWMAAMEATIFSGWIYDHLLPHAAQIKVAQLIS